MELWAGFECTLNRVGSVYFDQLVDLEQNLRSQCLGKLANLGVTKFRYRVAWDDRAVDWDLVASDIAIMNEIGVDPIIGLLHHGSGPEYTSLIADDFAEGLAKHARLVAERLPEIKYWTPVNEPLTTARFSALYGHWYPHLRDEDAFWLALINQIDATRYSMREIRRIHPEAQLIQTEDLGRTYGTAAMADQSAFDNQRRWMTWDLLCGQVVAGHPLHDYLCKRGFAGRLDAISSNPCPPDIIGVNHYLTSDRFLDHRVARYPAMTHGGNGRQIYADVEAVRVLGANRDGVPAALTDAWNRYNIPVALTECHNGCTREEQMRWLKNAWDNAKQLKSCGQNVVAVTSWSLIGSRNWASLLTTNEGGFETGAIDLRSGSLRVTGIGHMMATISGRSNVPVSPEGEGWWQRLGRLRYPPASVAGPLIRSANVDQVRPLLIAGANGTLGQAFIRAAAQRGLAFVATTRSEMPLDYFHDVKAVIDRVRPWAVINATGWVKVDDAENDIAACHSSNVIGAVNLARYCDENDLPNAHFSSDLVFGGTDNRLYSEDDVPTPLNVYGKTKAEADRLLLGYPAALIIRTAAFFSPFDEHNFAIAAVNALQVGSTLKASAQHFITPTYVPHLVDAVLDLLLDRATGLWHLTNGEELSWFNFARQIAVRCNLDTGRILSATPFELGWKAARPLRCGLRSGHGRLLPPLSSAIDAFSLEWSSSNAGHRCISMTC